jgi:hypothetical protein
VNRQRKGDILVLDSQQELQGFYASGSLLVLIQQAYSTMLDKGVLNLRNTAVGWNSGCIIFDGQTIAKLFCILYALAEQ